MSDPIPLFKVRMAPEAKARVAEVLDSGYIGQGPRVDEFERSFTRLVDAPHDVIALNSCTSAIDLALHLIGIGPGDEVISTPMTCTASNGGIVTRGATPVWADVDPGTGLIDPSSVRKRLTRRTKAIIAVDWAGEPCDYAELKKYGVPVIQDAAHSLLATSGAVESASGSAVLGDYVTWSFQAIKVLTTGDGGGLLVPRHQLDRARLLRWYGLDRRSSASFRCEQDIVEVGYKMHMNDIAAAIGLANLPGTSAAVLAHRRNARLYAEALHGVVRQPPPSPGSSSWIFSLLVDDRSKFIAHMAAVGIEASPVHARNDQHTAFRRYADGGVSLPGVDEFAVHQVAVPVGWWLSGDDVQRVTTAMLDWFARRTKVAWR